MENAYLEGYYAAIEEAGYDLEDDIEEDDIFEDAFMEGYNDATLFLEANLYNDTDTASIKDHITKWKQANPLAKDASKKEKKAYDEKVRAEVANFTKNKKMQANSTEQQARFTKKGNRRKGRDNGSRLTKQEVEQRQQAGLAKAKAGKQAAEQRGKVLRDRTKANKRQKFLNKEATLANNINRANMINNAKWNANKNKLAKGAAIAGGTLTLAKVGKTVHDVIMDRRRDKREQEEHDKKMKKRFLFREGYYAALEDLENN
jgi:hypothetical protein